MASDSGLITSSEWLTIPESRWVVKKTEVQSSVFVVDDEASVRRGLARLLEAAGYAVEMSPRHGHFSTGSAAAQAPVVS